MGVLIERGAAAADIIDDVRTTVTRATSKGGKWQEVAQARLGPTLRLADSIATRLRAATDAHAPLVAARDAVDAESDALLGEIYDTSWNTVGRPGSDPFLDVLFPGGSSWYADGPDEDQPVRMEILAELFDAAIHPSIPAAAAASDAARLRAKAAAYASANDALRGPAARVRQLERVQQAVARSAHTALAATKRAYRAENFSEADIHTVIPDRPRAKKKPTP